MSDTDVPPAAYAVLLLGSGSYFALMLVWFSLAAFLAQISTDLGLSGVEAGVVAGAVPLTYVPLAMFVGPTLDRIGARRGIAVAVVVFGTAQILRSAATGFPTLLAATILLGVGATGITFGLPKLVSGLFPPRQLGTTSTVYLLGAYAGVGTALSGGSNVLGPALGGWRPVFFWTGVAALAFSVVWIVGTWAYARKHGDPATSDAPFTPASFRTDLARVFSHRGMRLLVVIGTTYLLLQHGLQNWIPTVLEHRGVGTGTAGNVATLFVGGQAVGSVIVPPLSDRFENRRGAVALSGGVATGGVLAFLVADGLVLAAVGVVAVGIGIGAVSPLLRAIPAEFEEIGPQLTATAVGVIFMVGEIGGFAGPVLVGTVRDLTGSFAIALGVLSLAGVVMLIAGVGLPERG